MGKPNVNRVGVCYPSVEVVCLYLFAEQQYNLLYFSELNQTSYCILAAPCGTIEGGSLLIGATENCKLPSVLWGHQLL